MYNKLRGRIKEKIGTESKYAELLGLSPQSVSKKLQGKIPFSLKEAQLSVEILEIPPQDVYDYFFGLKVEK